MPLQASFRFGALVIKINAQGDQDLFHQIGIFSEAPGCCAKCGGTDIMPTHRSTVAKQGQNAGKRFDYYQLKCRNPECGALFDLGQKLDNEGLFPKNNPDDRANHICGWYLHSEQNFGGGGGDGGGYERQQNNQQGGNGGGQQRQQQQQPPSRGSNYQQGGQQQRGAPPGRNGPPQGQQRQAPPQEDYHEEDTIPF